MTRFCSVMNRLQLAWTLVMWGATVYFVWGAAAQSRPWLALFSAIGSVIITVCLVQEAHEADAD